MARSLRITRYHDKIKHTKRRIKNVEEWLKNLDSLEDELTILAIYKAGQEVIERLMDLLAMKLKDTKNIPRDDYTNIDQAYKEKMLTKDERETLKEANGLCNRLIHDYNELDDQIALDSLKGIVLDLKSFLKETEKWTQEFFEV